MNYYYSHFKQSREQDRPVNLSSFLPKPVVIAYCAFGSLCGLSGHPGTLSAVQGKSTWVQKKLRGGKIHAAVFTLRSSV